MSVGDAYFTIRKEKKGILLMPCMLYTGPNTGNITTHDDFETIIRKLFFDIRLINQRMDFAEITLPAIFSLSDNDSDRNEGSNPPDTESRIQSFTVTRTGNLASTHTVKWEIIPGNSNSVDANDFIFAGVGFPKGFLVFLPGEQTKTISIKISGDLDFEESEIYIIRLKEPSSGSSLSDSYQFNNTILNDD